MVPRLRRLKELSPVAPLLVLLTKVLRPGAALEHGQFRDGIEEVGRRALLDIFGRYHAGRRRLRITGRGEFATRSRRFPGRAPSDSAPVLGASAAPLRTDSTHQSQCGHEINRQITSGSLHLNPPCYGRSRLFFIAAAIESRASATQVNSFRSTSSPVLSGSSINTLLHNRQSKKRHSCLYCYILTCRAGVDR